MDKRVKAIELRPFVLVTVLVTAGAISATVGAIAGYGKGYERGDVDGRQAAVRSMASGLSTLMTTGLSIRAADGVDKRYVLTPVETQTN